MFTYYWRAVLAAILAAGGSWFVLFPKPRR
jgi:hypothetical protein